MSSSIIAPTADKALTAAEITVLWVIADELDRRRISSSIQDAVWLDIPSQNLRNPDGRDDNFWLRKCLRKLSKIEIEGVYRDTHWGAVMIAQWEFEQGGALTRVLVPPAAVKAIRAPNTFTKIETFAAYKLHGHAKLLYAALADKKRMAQTYWEYEVDELRALLGVYEKVSYRRWNNLRQWVLAPAIEAINDYGTVKVSMTPIRTGRSISSVRFDWHWKSLDDARETDEENERHSIARRKEPYDPEKESIEKKKQEWLEWKKDNKGSTYSDFLTHYNSEKQKLENTQ